MFWDFFGCATRHTPLAKDTAKRTAECPEICSFGEAGVIFLMELECQSL